jgi:hypothetical protein
MSPEVRSQEFASEMLKAQVISPITMPRLGDAEVLRAMMSTLRN